MCYATLIFRCRRFASSSSSSSPSLLCKSLRFLSSSLSQASFQASAAMVAHPKDEAYLTTVIPKRVQLFQTIQAQQLTHRLSLSADPIKITLPDKSVKEGKKWVTSPLDVAKEISKNLAANALIAKVNGFQWDMTRPLEGDCDLQIFKFEDDEGRDTFWHSSAHILGQDMSDELDMKIKKYLRGEGANLEALKDKKLKGQLSVREDLFSKSAKVAAKADKWLVPSEGGYLEAEGIEKTWRIKQEAIAKEVDILSLRNQYDIVLPALGPYTLDFTSSGRYMAIGGRKGHLGIVDMMEMNLIKEFQVRETVRDVVFLHNELFFAAAQKKYPYIYNRDGTELHCLKEHGAVLRLQFLKNHFLLASINKFGQLHYQDVTTGTMVGNYRTGLGRTSVMQVNSFNGVVALGHSGGTVTMWKPTSSAPLVKMLCHHGPLSALAIHSNGHLMATAGKDKKVKLWDLRKFEVLQTLPGHANTLDFSQKGLLACGTGSSIQVLRDTSESQKYSRYMTHSMVKGYQIGKLVFRPYEDVLGIGHSMGWSSILIPGSGEPNFDSWVANPFETSKQRREKEIRSLLDKLPPETIMLDPSKIGTVKPSNKKKPSKKEREDDMEEAIEAVKDTKMKKKTKGRNKPSKKMKKKKEALDKVKRPFLEQKIKEEEISRKRQKISEEVDLPKSLERFVRKASS